MGSPRLAALTDLRLTLTAGASLALRCLGLPPAWGANARPGEAVSASLARASARNDGPASVRTRPWLARSMSCTFNSSSSRVTDALRVSGVRVSFFAARPTFSSSATATKCRSWALSTGNLPDFIRYWSRVRVMFRLSELSSDQRFLVCRVSILVSVVNVYSSVSCRNGRSGRSPPCLPRTGATLLANELGIQAAADCVAHLNVDAEGTLRRARPR
jgi:hypothetical protein